MTINFNKIIFVQNTINMKKVQKPVKETNNELAKRKNILISLLFVLGITIIAYLPSIHNGFTNWDDEQLVIENTLIYNLSINGIKKIFSSFHPTLYNPLTFLSYAIEYKFFKLNPTVFHITNLILHLLNCLLVYWLIYLLSKNYIVSFITTILFAIHPLNVESVAWISERKGLLYALFFFCSIISYLYYIRTSFLNYYFLSIVMFILSLISKPSAVTLPFVLILIDYFMDRKYDKKIVFEKLLFIIISIIFGIITIIASMSNIKHEKSFVFPYNILNAINGISFYLTKMVAPIKLSCIYPAYNNLTVIDRIYGIIVFCLLITLTVISMKYTKKLLFSIMFFLITIATVLHIIPTGRGVPADRYVYVPLIGIFYFLGEAGVYFYNKKFNIKIIKYSQVLIFVIIITIFILLTYQRCKIWNNSITLWTDVLKKYSIYPDVAGLAYTNRGIAYAKKEEFYKSISDLNNAVNIDATKSAYANRGIAYAKIGDYDKAISDYTIAIKLDRNYIDAYYNRGIAYDYKCEYDKAIDDFNYVIKLNPGYAKAYNKRGYTYLKKHEYKKALDDFSQAIKIVPDYAEAYNGLGNVYFMEKQYDKSILNYNKAIEIVPNFVHAIYNRGITYYSKGEYIKALTDIQKAKSLGYKIDNSLLEQIQRMIKQH